MSTYVPVPVALGSITLPADGENIDAIDVNAPLQSVANGVAFLATTVASLAALAAVAAPADGTTRHVLGFGWYSFKTSATTGLSPFRVAAADLTPGGWLASHAYQTSVVRLAHPRFLPHLGVSAASPIIAPTGKMPVDAEIGNVRPGELYFVTAVTGSSTALAAIVAIDSLLVDGATLTLARLNWEANPGHAGLPVLMPKYGIARIDFGGSAPTNLLSTGSGLAADASANIAAYNAAHWNSFVPDQNNIVDRTQYNYYLVVWNEGGTNALVGASCRSIELTQTMTDGRRA